MQEKFKVKAKLFGKNNDHFRHPYKWSFRIKTNNRNVFRNMSTIMNKIFSGMFLPQKYGYDGKFNKTGKDIIANIPILDLQKKLLL